MSTRTTSTDGWHPEKEFLREALDRGTPILGVCLGSQLLAEAAGAAPSPHARAGDRLVRHRDHRGRRGRPAARPARPVGRAVRMAPLRGAAAARRRGARAHAGAACRRSASRESPRGGCSSTPRSRGRTCGAGSTGGRTRRRSRPRFDPERIRAASEQRIEEQNEIGRGIAERFLAEAARATPAERRSSSCMTCMQVDSRPGPGRPRCRRRRFGAAGGGARRFGRGAAPVAARPRAGVQHGLAAQAPSARSRGPLRPGRSAGPPAGARSGRRARSRRPSPTTLFAIAWITAVTTSWSRNRTTITPKTCQPWPRTSSRLRPNELDRVRCARSRSPGASTAQIVSRKRPGTISRTQADRRSRCRPGCRRRAAGRSRASTERTRLPTVWSRRPSRMSRAASTTMPWNQ